MVKGIGIGNKLWCPRIEQVSPFGGLNLLVHSLFPMSAIIRMHNVRAARRFCYSVPSAFRDLAKGNEAAAVTVLSTLNMPRQRRALALSLKTTGGVNGCADPYARYFGRMHSVRGWNQKRVSRRALAST
jgi:hypothetical protein